MYLLQIERPGLGFQTHEKNKDQSWGPRKICAVLSVPPWILCLGVISLQTSAIHFILHLEVQITIHLPSNPDEPAGPGGPAGPGTPPCSWIWDISWVLALISCPLSAMSWALSAISWALAALVSAISWAFWVTNTSKASSLASSCRFFASSSSFVTCNGN